MYYELLDYETSESLGIVKAVGEIPFVDFAFAEKELNESWTHFRKLSEMGEVNLDVDDFVEWHNEDFQCKIERIFLTQITPQP